MLMVSVVVTGAVSGGVLFALLVLLSSHCLLTMLLYKINKSINSMKV